MARWTASAKWAEGPALDGRRATLLGLGLNEGLGLTRPRANAFMECHKDAIFKPPKRAIAGPAKALTAPTPRTLLGEGVSLRGRWHNELTDAGKRKAPGSYCEAQT